MTRQAAENALRTGLLRPEDFPAGTLESLGIVRPIAPVGAAPTARPARWPRPAKDPTRLTEWKWQQIVARYARMRGWKVVHVPKVRKTDGDYRTVVDYDGKGFFDLVLFRDRVVFAELKSEDGRRTPEQEAWAGIARRAGQEVHLWKPSDWETVRTVLW